LLRKAIPSPSASRIGNPRDQKSASGSRRNSLNRTAVSCQSEDSLRRGVTSLLIAELPPGQRHEHVLERRRVRAELRQLVPATRDQRQKGRDDPMKLLDLKFVATHHSPCGANARHGGQFTLVERSSIGDRELHDVLQAE